MNVLKSIDCSGRGRTDGDSFLEQDIRARNAQRPPWLLQPNALLEALCR
jgi:hypothetical protein